MESHRSAGDRGTPFDPLVRLDDESVRGQRQAFLADPAAAALLEAMIGPVLVLNRQRQIVAANGQFLEIPVPDEAAGVLGARPGEALDCAHSDAAPGGCGAGEHCALCGIAQAIERGWATRGRVQGECRITTRGAAGGGALDFRVQVTFLEAWGEPLVVLALQDISAEKRRAVLERVFLHDVLNACGGLSGLAEMLVATVPPGGMPARLAPDILRSVSAIVDEITGHREMLAAERGELEVRVEDVAVKMLLEDLLAVYRHHPVTGDRVLRLGACEPGEMRTDPVLLRRVLGNLVKNALEATPPGGTVTLSAEAREARVRFAVHNPGVIPAAVRLQIFERSFSTKAGSGRGVGTYGVRLLTERHLGGRVDFTSDAGSGTRFLLELPVALDSTAAPDTEPLARAA